MISLNRMQMKAFLTLVEYDRISHDSDKPAQLRIRDGNACYEGRMVCVRFPLDGMRQPLPQGWTLPISRMSTWMKSTNERSRILFRLDEPEHWNHTRRQSVKTWRTLPPLSTPGEQSSLADAPDPLIMGLLARLMGMSDDERGDATLSTPLLADGRSLWLVTPQGRLKGLISAWTIPMPTWRLEERLSSFGIDPVTLMTLTRQRWEHDGNDEAEAEADAETGDEDDEDEG